MSPNLALWISETFEDIDAVSVWQLGLRNGKNEAIVSDTRVTLRSTTLNTL